MGFAWSFFLLNKKQGIITKGLFSSFIEIVIKLKLFGILIYCLCFFLDRGEQSSTHESKHKLEKVLVVKSKKKCVYTNLSVYFFLMLV